MRTQSLLDGESESKSARGADSLSASSPPSTSKCSRKGSSELDAASVMADEVSKEAGDVAAYEENETELGANAVDEANQEPASPPA